MKEFTLLTAFTIIARHFLVTIVLFSVTLWGLPSLNLLENRYTVEKIVKPGKNHSAYLADLLRFKEMSEIVPSPHMHMYLNEALGGGVSQFELSQNETGNIYDLENILHFKSITNEVNIVTADGGFDFSIDFNRQEFLAQRLIFCELVTAFSVQKVGGCFICKFFWTTIT